MMRWIFLCLLSFATSAAPPYSGVNLPSMQPYPHWVRVYEAESFQDNLNRANWNTFRLPISWEYFTEPNGQLDLKSFHLGLRNVQALLDALKRYHQQRGNPEKLFLILDFHQYKFGSACGGVGIPSVWVQHHNLTPSDPSCFFKAFQSFWSNEHGLQNAWIDWMKLTLISLKPLLEKNSAWLDVGVEPMNEPFWGVSALPWTNAISSQLFTAPSASQFVERAIRTFQQQQIERDLLPFYERVVSRLEADTNLRPLLRSVTWVFQPFLLDHVNLMLPTQLFSLPVSISLDGDYSKFRRLLHGGRKWIAAPHHYFGARDNGFILYLPPQLQNPFLKYPNRWANAASLEARFIKLKERMAEAGMDILMGEWGTDLPLLDENGNPGAHIDWIRDSQKLISDHTLGSLWWSYDFDLSSNQSRFYLLHSPVTAQGLDWDRQELKCDTPETPAALLGWCS